ncbi:MAG: hypothetical protein ACO1OO_11185 [Flavisolibacter sp.]
MRKLLYGCIFLAGLISCGDDNNEPSASENDVDAARNFIRSALDGNYQKARDYMLQDSLNNQLLSTFDDNYRLHMDREEKRAYRESSIRIADMRKLNDSATVVMYSNSYKNKPDSLKVVRRDGKWLVDFKYSFLIKDSLP